MGIHSRTVQTIYISLAPGLEKYSSNGTYEKRRSPTGLIRHNMGWFSTGNSQAAPPPPEPSQDGGFIAPDRSARAVCWEGRDNFFKCLDRNGIVDSVKEDEKARQACAPELAQFEKACASSWVTYFKKRRVMEFQRDQTLKKLNAEGATPMDSSTAGGAGAAALRGK